METLGLQGIFDIAGFSRGIDEYTSKLGAAAQQTDQSEGIFGKLGNALGGAVKIGVAATVGGVVALTGVIVGAAGAAGEWGNKLDSIGDILGTTTTESAGLAVAVERAGGNAEQFANQLVFMGKNLEGANGKLGKSGLAIQALGVSAYDANGKLRGTSAIAQDVATKVALMPDGLEKSEVLMNIFGRSGKDLSDVMTGLANGGLDAATQQAKDFGLAMSDDTVAASIASGREMKKLEQAIQGLVIGFGSQLLPVILPIIQQLLSMAMSALPAVRDAINEVIKFLSPLIQGIGTLIQAFQTGSVNGFAGGLSNVFYMLGKVNPIFITLGDITNGVADAIEQLFKDISQGNSVVGILSQFISGLGTAFGLTEDDAYNLGDAVYNALTPIVSIAKGVTQAVDDLFQGFSLGQPVAQNLSEFVSELGQTFGLTEEQGIALGDAFTAVFNAISEIVTADITQVIAIISSLQPVFDGLMKIVDGAGATVAKSLPKMQEIFTTAGDVISKVIEAVSAVIQAVFGEVAVFLQNNGDDISKFIDDTWNTILDIIQLTLKLINATIVPALNAIASFIKTHSDTIQSLFKSVWNIISTIISTALAIIKGVIQAVLQLINGDTQGALNTLSGVFNTVWEGIKVIVSNAINVVKSVIDLVLGALGTSVEGLLNNIKTSFERNVDNIKNSVSNGFDSVKNSIVGSVQNALNGIGDLLGRFYDKGRDIVNNIVSGINNIAGRIRDTITGVINGAVNDALKFINDTIAGIRKTIGDITNTIENIKRSLGLGGFGYNITGAGSAAGNTYASTATHSDVFSPNYNLNVSSNEPVQNISQTFAIMEAIAAG